MVHTTLFGNVSEIMGHRLNRINALILLFLSNPTGTSTFNDLSILRLNKWQQ